MELDPQDVILPGVYRQRPRWLRALVFSAIVAALLIAANFILFLLFSRLVGQSP